MDEPRRLPTETPQQDAEVNFGPEVGTGTEPETRRAVAAHTAQVAGAFQDLVTPTHLALAAAALGLLLVGALGGWKNLDDRVAAVKTISPRQEFEASPFKLALTRGLSFTGQPDILPLQAGERALMIGADVTNTSDQPVLVGELEKAFRISAEGLTNFGRPVSASEARPTVKRASDNLNLTAIQPGLKTRVALLWVQSTAQPVPTNVTVTVFKQTYRQSALDGSMDYFDPTEAAQVKLPVQALGNAP